LRIVDAYCHVGDCRIYELSVTESDVVDALNASRVSAAILQPFPGTNPALVHDRIAELGAKHPGRIYGVASANPHIHRDRYHQEIERCVRELGFVGVALDTFGHAVNPTGQDAKTVFEVARELSIPVVVETGWGTPFGMPSLLFQRVREYSDVRVVLANSGAGFFAREACLVARDAPNVYISTAGCPVDDIRYLVSELGATRVMLGSDRPANLEVELAKYRSLGLFQFQQFNVLGQTAVDVFNLKGVTELAEPVPTGESTTSVAEETPAPSSDLSTTVEEAPSPNGELTTAVEEAPTTVEEAAPPIDGSTVPVDDGISSADGSSNEADEAATAPVEEPSATNEGSSVAEETPMPEHGTDGEEKPAAESATETVSAEPV